MNDNEQSEYFWYVSALYALNSHLLAPAQMPSDRVFNAFAWGYIEELYEWNLASGEESIKEAGDVLAYATLLLLTHCTVEQTANKLKEELQRKISKDNYLDHLLFASNIKRFNREGEALNITLVCGNLAFVFDYQFAVHSQSFSDIAKVNIEKLTSRAQRNVMFSGRGDNR